MNEMRKLMEIVQLDEVASSRQWEIAINNLIGEGDEKYGIRGPGAAQSAVWEWVRSELHGMLDFQPDDLGPRIGRDGSWPDEQK